MHSWRQQAERHLSNPGQVVGLAAALFVSVYLAALYLPRRAVMQELARQCAELDNIAVAQTAELAELESVDSSPEAVLEIERALPTTDNPGKLLTTLTQLARSAGLRLHQAEHRLDAGKGVTPAVVFVLTVHGDFVQTMELVATIEDLDRIVEVRNLSLKTTAKEGSDGEADDRHGWEEEPVTVQARMELWAYRWSPISVTTNHRQTARADIGDRSTGVGP